jgi:hypothetical protein
MKKISKSVKVIDAKKQKISSPVITDSDQVFVNGGKDNELSRFLIILSKVKEKIRELFEGKK